MTHTQNLKGKGLAIATAYQFEDEPSSMVHEQLARLKFAESHISMEGKKILEFGCGTGYNCYYLASRNSPKEVVGIDILSDCIEYCKENYATQNTKFVVQDCLEYTETLGSFDIIICNEVVEHVADQVLFIRNLARYLVPGGYAFISTPNRALFSFSKEKSFLNATHVRELFFPEFQELLQGAFSEFTIYSQIHKGPWHVAYINYLSAMNYAYAIKNEGSQNGLVRKILSKISRILYTWIFRYPDVRKRKYTDFEFLDGFDSRAVWFNAICRKPV